MVKIQETLRFLILMFKVQWNGKNSRNPNTSFPNLNVQKFNEMELYNINIFISKYIVYLKHYIFNIKKFLISLIFSIFYYISYLNIIYIYIKIILYIIYYVINIIYILK